MTLAVRSGSASLVAGSAFDRALVVLAHFAVGQAHGAASAPLARVLAGPVAQSAHWAAALARAAGRARGLALLESWPGPDGLARGQPLLAGPPRVPPGLLPVALLLSWTPPRPVGRMPRPLPARW